MNKIESEMLSYKLLKTSSKSAPFKSVSKTHKWSEENINTTAVFGTHLRHRP